MAKVTTMEEFKEQMIKITSENPDWIPIFTDVGFGRYSVPTQKNPTFRLGEVILPASALKEEYRDDLHKIRSLKIRTIVFIPPEMVSSEVMELIKEPCAPAIAKEKRGT